LKSRSAMRMMIWATISARNDSTYNLPTGDEFTTHGKGAKLHACDLELAAG
jgi:hypothetical protein